MRVLIAFPSENIGLAREIDQQLTEAADGRQADIDSTIVFDVASAQAKGKSRANPITHLIVQERLAADRQSSPCMGVPVELAASLKVSNSDLKVVLIPKLRDQKWSVAEITRLNDVGAKLIEPGPDLVKEVVAYVLDSKQVLPVIDIIIDLSRGERKYEFSISCNDRKKPPLHGTLELRASEMPTLRVLTQNLDQQANWAESLEALRSNLYDSLIHQQLSFREALWEFMRDGDNRYQTRVSFRIDETKSDVAFEAIKHPKEDEYWMLRSPVIRSFESTNAIAAPPIFDGKNGRLDRCLIVLSEANGLHTYTDGKGSVTSAVNYADLKRAREECESLIERLEREKKTVGMVKTIGFNEPLTSKLLADTLKQKWDLVHYIGHTDFNAGNGFLILPGNDDDPVMPLAIDEVAPDLRETPFVYLSSCEGAKAPFVRRLAEHRVPCMLGFRTKVPDHLALDHAKVFYDRLLSSSSIEQAFLETRQHFYREFKSERLWACSSLVVQTRN